jgi:hypothetical protein
MKQTSSGAEWYLAELVMEITVSGATRNVVHRNLVLVRAGSPDAAFDKAIHFGRAAETSYENPAGQFVQIKFCGLSKLELTYEDLEDGAELTFEEHIGVQEAEIEALIPPRNELSAFVVPKPGREHDPDYRSKAFIEMVVDQMEAEKRKR